jgi:hypothetical protein
MVSISVGSKEPLSVEVDHVVWGVGGPDIGFPGDGFCETAESGEIRECGEQDQILTGMGKMTGNFFASGFFHVTGVV